MKTFLPVCASLGLLCTLLTHRADASDVLHVSLSGSYNADSQKISTALSQIPGVTVQTIVLTASTVFPTDLSGFEQIWLTDFSAGTDSYPTAYQRIAQWYNANNKPDAIFDGRLLADIFAGAQNTALITNYYTNLNEQGFGIVIASDHDAFHANGANTLSIGLGFNGFFGFSGVQDADADVTHPLMIEPQQAWYMNGARRVVKADSSPGFVPFNLQPNGERLYGIAWANGSLTNPLISTTLPIPEPTTTGAILIGALALSARTRARRRQHVSR